MPSKVARTSQRLLNSAWIKPFGLLILTVVLWDVVKAFWTEGDELLIAAVPTTLATLGGFFLFTLFSIPIAMLIAGSRTIESYVCPATHVALRHTISLLDTLEGTDGLEGGLAHAGLQLFKIKIGGNVEADIARLRNIHDLLSRRVPDYHATLDAKEQYDAEFLAALQLAMSQGALKPSRNHLLYVEQPFDRSATFTAPLSGRPEALPFITGEADADYDAFPRAVRLGYRGVSSKTCKGFYKSFLNAARGRPGPGQTWPVLHVRTGPHVSGQAWHSAGQGPHRRLGTDPRQAQRPPSCGGLRSCIRGGGGLLRGRTSQPLSAAWRPHQPGFRRRMARHLVPACCPRFRQRS
jgi:hypothetical protein